MYLDTTLLVKQYFNEADSEEARKFLARAKRFPQSSELTRMEMAATFHRKLRESLVTAEQLSRIRMQFEMDVSDGRIEWLMLTQSIIRRVETAFRTLPANIFLRAGDAAHLATAVEAGFKEIYSNDRHLLAAAPLFKLKGINPLAK